MSDTTRAESPPPVVVGDLPAPHPPPAAEAINDGVVTAKLRAGLAADPVTRTYLIEVEFFHGTLLLSGYVEFEEVRQHAAQLAVQIVGVTDVKNLLEIRERAP